MPRKPQPRSVSRLEREHGPAVVHQVGDGDEELHAEEDPGRPCADARSSLHLDIAVQPEAEVGQIERHVDEDQEWCEEIEVALCAFPLLDVIAVVQADNGAWAIRVIQGPYRLSVVHDGRMPAEAGIADAHLIVQAGFKEWRRH